MHCVYCIFFVNKICKLAKWLKCISNEFDLFSKYKIIIIHFNIIIDIGVSFINIYIMQFNSKFKHKFGYIKILKTFIIILFLSVFKIQW